MRRFGIVGLMGLLLLAACGPGQPASLPTSEVSRQTGPLFPARVSDAGQVEMEVVPLNLNQPQESLHFQVAMNTHTVELDFDLTRLAQLRTDRGEAVLPLRWDGARGGHHIAGVLYFPLVDLEGARWIEVVIQNVAAVPERSFRWELGAVGP